MEDYNDSIGPAPTEDVPLFESMRYEQEYKRAFSIPEIGNTFAPPDAPITGFTFRLELLDQDFKKKNFRKIYSQHYKSDKLLDNSSKTLKNQTHDILQEVRFLKLLLKYVLLVDRQESCASSRIR